MRRTTVMLTEGELLAIDLAMGEYCYLIEEGNISELLAERDMDSAKVPLTAKEAAELRDRIRQALDGVAREPAY